ncbi:MAG: hypothetical protein EZS28_001573, partial [Streblomastix strix]
EELSLSGIDSAKLDDDALLTYESTASNLMKQAKKYTDEEDKKGDDPNTI